MFFTLFGHWVQRGRVPPKGLVHNVVTHFFALGTSKIEVAETFFGIVITHDDHPSHGKHVLGSVYVPT